MASASTIALRSRGAFAASLIFCAVGLVFTLWFVRIAISAPAGEIREELFSHSYLLLVALAGWLSGLPVVCDRLFRKQP